jgi:excisionase family DNA binding protein
MNPQPLLTREEVARQLNISLRTVDRVRRRGLLPAVQIGKAVRFDPRVVAQFITQSTCSTAEEE